VSSLKFLNTQLVIIYIAEIDVSITGTGKNIYSNFSIIYIEIDLD